MNRRKLPCLLHNVYLVVFLKLRKHKDSGALLPAVVDHLSAELMRIIVVQVFQLLPVFPVGSGIVPTSAGFPGFLDPVQYQLTSVGIFRSSFQEKASFFSAGTVHDAADQQSVFVGKDRRTDFFPCRHTLFCVSPVRYLRSTEYGVLSGHPGSTTPATSSVHSQELCFLLICTGSTAICFRPTASGKFRFR